MGRTQLAEASQSESSPTGGQWLLDESVSVAGGKVNMSGVGRYDLGLFQTPSGPLYVGAGVGCFYLNLRFNCRPEITVIEM